MSNTASNQKIFQKQNIKDSHASTKLADFGEFSTEQGQSYAHSYAKAKTTNIVKKNTYP